MMLAFRCVYFFTSKRALDSSLRYATGHSRLRFAPKRYHGNPQGRSLIHFNAPLDRTFTSSVRLPPSATAGNTLQPSTLTPATKDGLDDMRDQFQILSQNGSSELNWTEDLVRGQFPFELDQFQLDALKALTRGESLVLSAPTGAGKTIVGEMAVYLALCKNLRVFYTTPLKALSNQKFYDFKKQFGEHRVGLLTGDVTVNRDADIIVMTTEVYRNMLYADSTESGGMVSVTDNLFAVVFDEFHYLNDRDRGTVWEESVINSPDHVLLVALSATMSNTADVRDWFCSVQGPTALVQSSLRPVPLNFAYCDQEGMTPLFAESSKKKESRRRKRGFGKGNNGAEQEDSSQLKLHPKLLRKLKEAKDERKGTRRSRRGSRGDLDEDDKFERIKGKYREVVERNRNGRRDRYAEIPSFPYVVRTLRRREMLPCIVFIFSRAGCDRAAASAATERADLVSEAERREIKTRLDEFVKQNPGMVQPDRIDLALKGIASHHAGLLPLWKLCVEELFQDGLIKVVFATETLAAGINMPARTTVISALSKRAGEEGFVALTTSEVLQMAGRAGRRGKDIVGHSMILRSRNEGAFEAFKVLSAEVDALESKFTPTYGMVLNLLSSKSLNEAKKLVDRSFGNFLRKKRFEEQSKKASNGKSYSNEELETIAREKGALEAVLVEARNLLKTVDDKELRSYVKCLERVKAEKRALAYLVQQSSEMDSELIEDTLAFAPSGTRLLLKQKSAKKSLGAQRRQGKREYSAAIAAAGEGDLGAELRTFYFSAADQELEDIDEEEGGEAQVIEAVLIDMHSESAGVLPTFAAADANGELRLFHHTAVSRLFYDEEAIDVANIVPNWSELSLPERSEWKSIGGEQYTAPLPEEIRPVVSFVAKWQEERKLSESGEDGLSRPQYPEVGAQQGRVDYAKQMVKEHRLHQREDIASLIAAKRAIPRIEGTLNGTVDPFGSSRRKGKTSKRYLSVKSTLDSTRDTSVERLHGNTSWGDFMSIVSVLQHYGFIDEAYQITNLGSLGAKVRSENELWTSLLLMQPQLKDVSPAYLGAVLGASQMEASRNDVYIEHEISDETKSQIEMMLTEKIRLQAVQNEFDVDMNIDLDPELMGLVEAWASGISWVELLSGTSLQEGDACRILRRVLDLLRQVQYLPQVSDGLKLNSRRAVALLDRFPVTDEQTYVVRKNERTAD